MKKPIKKNNITKLDGVRKVSSIRRARSWVFYGRAGSGKTTLASTFPAPILLIDIRDHGTDSISDVDEVYSKEVESLDDLEDIYYWLKDNLDHYKTIVLDTTTQLQQVFMEEIIKGKSKNGRAAGDWGSMTRRQFGDLSALMKEWLLNYRNLTDEGMEVVFIAQERTNNVEEESDRDDNLLVPEVGPAMMPSIAGFLNANVSVIGNTFIRMRRTKVKRGNKTTEREDAVYCLRIGPNPIYTTKIRKPKGVEAPAYIENATYADINEVIKGE